MKTDYRYRNPYPLGAHVEGDRIRFSFASKVPGAGSRGVLLYDRKTCRRLEKLSFSEEERVGNIYCKWISGIEPASVTYQFYEDDRIILDEYAGEIVGNTPYGKERNQADLRAGILTESFEWGDDKRPGIPYAQMICYCLHVRGFTKHVSSKVRNRGTFKGIAEKIPYLKETGITTLELQPAYEFLEFPAGGGQAAGISAEAFHAGGSEGEKKINYWGYKKGYYYAPKASYAASGKPSEELKGLIKELHLNGMELVMQFYFPDEIKRSEIADILRFWVLEYHVDGFHLMGENMGAELLAADALLADTKLWYYRFEADMVYGREGRTSYPHIAEYNDSWMYDMRRFLKGDENMLSSVLYHMRHIPEKSGRIHYLTNYYGFTLADLFSYDFKHNQANGEDNRDGNNYNCSWNCGDEGVTRKMRVKKLRCKQMKNAMCLLLLSQSTPLIFMGDEFGNSQKGNNNPYCQDNAVAWLDWTRMEKNSEIYAFWKQLVAFRRAHPILHPARELRLMDYAACGYPDLSYHGQSAWKPRTDGYFRYIGQMYCGKYVQTDEGREDDFLYVALNMHWEQHQLALPKLPRGMRWELAFSTEEDGEGVEENDSELLKTIAPRSISVYRSVNMESETCGRSEAGRIRRNGKNGDNEKKKAVEK